MAKKKKPPTYTQDEARALKSAGLSTKLKHAFGTVRAIEAVPEAQRGRIRDIAKQERMVVDSERVDTSRAAMVSPLSDALFGLPDKARQGLEGYFAAYMESLPGGSMDYEPRVGGGGTYQEPEVGRTDALAAIERALGRKRAKSARFAVLLPQGAVIATWQAENAERVGLALYDLLDMREE